MVGLMVALRALSEIVLVIHCVGGVHTELRLPKRRRGQRNATPDDIVEAVRQLVLIANDDVIAGVLNRNGLTTGNGNRWTRERVTALRSYRRIPVFRPQIDGFEPWLNLGGTAKLLLQGLPMISARLPKRYEKSSSRLQRRLFHTEPGRATPSKMKELVTIFSGRAENVPLVALSALTDPDALGRY
ncbi:hypothetical protein [Sinorhizobium medicae]|uniref:hypothetical protein n=1 Tax=Sinorhizobium medicae TaxID=110321 RepID=UPI0027DE972E|nr:hypothetical protein [Sinorhizobium medicae]